MDKLCVALAVSIFLFSNIAFAEIQTELIAPFGGTIISKNQGNENIIFSYSDSNESENLFLTFGYHYFGQQFSANIIIQDADLKQFCQDEDNNSITLQNCSIDFDSTQLISTPMFLDLQISAENISAELSTAEIAINNTYPEIIEYYPEGKTDNYQIKFTVQSADSGIDIAKLKVIVNDDIETQNWAEKCQILGSEKTVHCEWFSELVKEGENFVYVESHDIIGNGSYASAKEWSFIFEKPQDKNPLKIKIDYPENNSELATNEFDIKFSVSDAESEINESALMLDGQVIAFLEPNSEVFKLIAEDGDHNLTLMAYDDAQNYSELTINFSIKKPEPENLPIELETPENPTAMLENEQENQPVGGESFPWLKRNPGQNGILSSNQQEMGVQQAPKNEAELEDVKPIEVIPQPKKKAEKNQAWQKKSIDFNSSIKKNIADMTDEKECLLELISKIAKYGTSLFEIKILHKDSGKIYKSANALLVSPNKLLIKGVDCFELDGKIIEEEDYIIDIIGGKGIPLEKMPEIEDEFPENLVKTLQSYLPITGFAVLENNIPLILLILILILLAVAAKKALERKRRDKKQEYGWLEEQ